MQWQYERNPAGPPVIELARDATDRTIVGQYVVIPMRVAVRGEVVAASLSLNTLVDERFRGQGMFTKLAERVYADCAARDLAFTYGFPNQNSYPGFVRSLRFADVGHIPMLVRPVAWGRLLATQPRLAWAAPAAAAAGSVHRAIGRWRRGASLASGITLREVTGFDEGWDVFWERNRGRYEALVARSREYLDWRFVQVPERRYRVLAAEGPEGWLAYLVLRRTRSFGLDVGFIVDFFVDGSPAGHAAGLALVRRAVDLLEDDGVELMGAHALPHTLEYRLLRAGGLWPCPERLLPRPTPVIVRTHTAAGEPHPLLFDLRRWHLTLGDYDAV